MTFNSALEPLFFDPFFSRRGAGAQYLLFVLIKVSLHLPQSPSALLGTQAAFSTSFSDQALCTLYERRFPLGLNRHCVCV